LIRSTKSKTLASPSNSASYRFNWVGRIGLLILITWAVVAAFGSTIAPHDVGDIVDDDFFGPMRSGQWLGSDYLGRDVLSRILVGAKYTVGISLGAAALACTIGVVLGMVAAVWGGAFDLILSRILDALNSIPSLLFGLVVVSGVGSSIPILIVGLSVIYTPGSYRFARALAVNCNAMDFILAARARGEGSAYLIFQEVLPNILGPVLADVGVRFVYIVLVLSGLSFLGLGVQPPNADWGALVRENIAGLSMGAPAVVLPSFAIASLTVAMNMFIDNLPKKIRDRSAQ
jgi:peptide/nickel transport system permease protein